MHSHYLKEAKRFLALVPKDAEVDVLERKKQLHDLFENPTGLTMESIFS